MTQQIDIDILANQLLGDWGALRKEVRAEIASSKYQSSYDLPYTKYRKQTLKNISNLAKCEFAKVGFPKNISGGLANAGGGLAVFEELIFLDASTQIKYGVQFGLFASAIMHLGTEYHHNNILPSVVNFSTPGCFAMTETGHGSDVSNIQTTAIYSHSTKELIINSPSKKAWKDYIGNAAKDGKAAVVFAQLIVDGENHGVHAIYVPLRNSFGFHYKGVQTEDDGYKGGLNGIDNGRIRFTNVRVPKQNLLNRYGDIDESGRYNSPIESKGKRFFTMLSTLVQGRVSLVGAVTNAEKLALLIAMRYAHERTQFKKADGKEFKLIDYPSHQKRLYDRLASTYAQIGMHQTLVADFHRVFSDPNISDEAVAKLETDAAAIKAIATWNALKTIQIAREACGGQGFLSENRLVELRKDLDVYATFEGDNHVLLQLVARRLLQEYSEEMKHPEVEQIFSYISHSIIKESHTGYLIGAFKDIIAPIKKVALGKKSAGGNNLLEEILEKQLQISIEELAYAFKKAAKETVDKESAFLYLQNSLIELGKNYAYLLQYQGLEKLIYESKDSVIYKVLKDLKTLFVINRIEEDAASYLTKGLIGINTLTELIESKQKIYNSIREQDINLVEAFDIEDRLVRAPIGLGAEARRNLS